MIKIFIFGITCKIGKLIVNFIKSNKKIILLGGINSINLNKIFKKKYLKIFNNLILNGLFIDFSNEKIIKKIIFLSFLYNIKLIIGTSGYNNYNLHLIKKLSNYVSILLSYNMSIGLNLIIFFLSNAKKYLLNYNFESFIIDIHHDKKKDAPSGTSLMIYSKIKEINKKILNIRIKNIIGNHIIYIISKNEIIKLEHFVTNKNIFSIGIIYSIIWIFKKEKGFYSMYDVFFS